MNLRIPHVLYADEIIDKAFGSASKIEVDIDPKDRVNSIRDKELAKMDAVYNIINDQLTKTHNSFPMIDEMAPAYSELIGVVMDKGDLKKSLAALNWARGFCKELLMKHKKMIHGSSLKDLGGIRRGYYGRVRSVLKQISKNLIFLEDARVAFRKLPELQDLPTVVIAGFPNVGKSSLLKALTGAEPEIQPYPFTTKGILIGYIENQLQIIDTPGLLDRPLNERSKIELQAVVALRHLANKILFIMDPTETCGYSIDKQIELLGSIKNEFKAPIITCINKKDLLENNLVNADFYTSCSKNEGIKELKEHLLKTTKLTLAKSFRKK